MGEEDSRQECFRRGAWAQGVLLQPGDGSATHCRGVRVTSAGCSVGQNQAQAGLGTLAKSHDLLKLQLHSCEMGGICATLVAGGRAEGGRMDVGWTFCRVAHRKLVESVFPPLPAVLAHSTSSSSALCSWKLKGHHHHHRLHHHPCWRSPFLLM